MTDWKKIDKVTIFKGSDKNGNRYLNAFLSEYKDIFNPDMVNAGCQRCLEDYYINFINYLQMGVEKKVTGYVLKSKYNGIPLEFGSGVLVTNTNMTQEYGDILLNNHSRGKELFDKIPKFNTDSDLTRKELQAIATNLGLNPKKYKNKTEILKAISEKQE